MGKKTWEETALAAGVVTMVQADGTSIEEVVSQTEANKKRTPFQYRSQQPKVKDVGKKLTMPEKKLFKGSVKKPHSRKNSFLGGTPPLGLYRRWLVKKLAKNS